MFNPFKSFNRSPFDRSQGRRSVQSVSELRLRFERLERFERFELLCSRFSEQLLHLAHSLLDADDDRPSDNAVPDIELDDFRNAGDG